MRYTDVYEHGIEILRGVEVPPSGLLRLATNDRGPNAGFVYEVVDKDGTFPNYRAAKLSIVNGNICAWHYYEEKDMRYCLKSALYHLNRMLELYVFKRQQIDKYSSSAGLRGSTSEPRIYFEIDAFLGTARRIYDAISRLLWKHYAAPRGRTGRWRSIRAAIDDSDLPTDFAASLNESWESVGKTLADYRDCVIHYSPLTSTGSGVCYFEKFDDRWGLSVPLPTNAETRRRYDFDNVRGEGVDALKYCYGVATHLTALCEDAMALPPIAEHMQNPPPMS